MRVSLRILLGIWSVCAAFFVVACGGDEGTAPAKSVVLVVDDGFDLSLSAFKGKVLEARTFSCKSDQAPSEAPTDLAAAKQQYLNFLKTKDTSCTLKQGISEKPDLLADIQEDFQEQWNGTIETQTYASARFTETEYRQLTERFDETLAGTEFHGSATAGVIARDNPGVRLVLVERPLGSGQNIEEDFVCLEQAEIDRDVQLLEDPEIKQAYTTFPRPKVAEEMEALMLKHKVQIVNESFGALPRQALEELQASKDCEPVDLKRMFALIAELDSAWRKSHPGTDVLVVKAVGNSASQIDGAEDLPICGVAEQTVFVGSYDKSMKKAEFTNVGDCVDVFAPGVGVVAPITGNWLIPLSGTSFSAPLVVRVLSMQDQAWPFISAPVKANLLSQRDAQRRLPSSMFARSLTYDPFSGPVVMALSSHSTPDRGAWKKLRAREWDGRPPLPLIMRRFWHQGR